MVGRATRAPGARGVALKELVEDHGGLDAGEEGVGDEDVVEEKGLVLDAVDKVVKDGGELLLGVHELGLGEERVEEALGGEGGAQEGGNGVEEQVKLLKVVVADGVVEVAADDHE